MFFSYKKEEGNQSGFQINPGTTGKLYNNIINGGNGFGIFMIGRGENLVFNNLIINPSYDGIQVGDRTPSKDAAFGFKFLNNTIVNPKSKGYVSYTKETKGNEFINNIIVAPSGIYFDNKSNFTESNNILVKDIAELMFASPGSLDYSLLEGSPAIDKGKDVSLSGIIDDILGKKRDVNVNPYDVGAYEFQKKR